MFQKKCIHIKFNSFVFEFFQIILHNIYNIASVIRDVQKKYKKINYSN